MIMWLFKVRWNLTGSPCSTLGYSLVEATDPVTAFLTNQTGGGGKSPPCGQSGDCQSTFTFPCFFLAFLDQNITWQLLADRPFDLAQVAIPRKIGANPFRKLLTQKATSNLSSNKKLEGYLSQPTLSTSHSQLSWKGTYNIEDEKVRGRK